MFKKNEIKQNKTNLSFPKKEVGRGKVVMESKDWEARGYPRALGPQGSQGLCGQDTVLLHPSACLAVPTGHLSQVWLAEGRAPYGCL